MSQRTTTPATLEARILPQMGKRALEQQAIYQAASEEHKALLERDMAAVMYDGLEIAEYIDALDGFDTAEQALLESGLLIAAPEAEERDAAAATAPAAESPAPVVEEQTVPADPVQAAKEQNAADEAAEQERQEAILHEHRQAGRKIAKGAMLYAKAERGLVSGHVRAGRLWHAAMKQKAATASNDAGRKEQWEMGYSQVQTALGNLGVGKADINRVVRISAAWDILAAPLKERTADMPNGKAIASQVDAIAYTQWRESWTCLIEQVGIYTAESHYVLLKGREEQCEALFASMVGKGNAEVYSAVQTMLEGWKKAEQQLRTEALAATQAERARVEGERKAELAKVEVAEREQDRLKREADAATSDEARKQLTEQMTAAKAERDEAARLANARADEEIALRAQEARDKQAKDKADAEAAKRAEAAARAAQKEREKAAPKPQDKPEECRAPVARVEDMGKAGTPVDIADAMLRMMLANPNPDQVWLCLLEAVKDSAKVDRPTKRSAIKGIVAMSEAHAETAVRQAS